MQVVISDATSLMVMVMMTAMRQSAMVKTNRAQRLANTNDPLPLMANTQKSFHLDHSSPITYIQHLQPNNNFVQQPSFNTNYMQQPMQNPEDILDLTIAIDMTLALTTKAFTLNNTTPTNNNQKSSSNPSNMQIVQPGMNMDQDRHMLMVEDNVGNQFRPNAVQNVKNQVVQNAVQNPTSAEGNGTGINGNPIRCYNYQGEGHYASNCIVKPRKWDAAYLQQQLQISQEEEAGIQSSQEEFKFMATVDAYEETEGVKANCILENNLQPASTSGTQSDKALVYDSDGSAEKALELEIERLLRVVVSQDIMSVVQRNSVVDTSNIQTELEQCKYGKISYDKAYNDMQQKIERMQAQLGDLKGKCKDTSSVSNTLDPLP
nr:hypothetical protein [Tanacetum cinerariifolium]